MSAYWLNIPGRVCPALFRLLLGVLQVGQSLADMRHVERAVDVKRIRQSRVEVNHNFLRLVGIKFG